jgi:SMODS and SLOG-associating 2TM effector domain 1
VSAPDGAPQAGGAEVSPENEQSEEYKNARAKQFAALYAKDRIQDQLGFYRDRRTAAERARDQAIHAKWALSTLAAIAGSVGAAVPDWRAGLAIAAAFLAAAATAVAAYQSLYGYPRLAKIYQDAERSLAALNAAGAGFNADLPAEQIRAVADRVESIFRQENGQWGQLMQHSGEAGPDSGAR